MADLTERALSPLKPNERTAFVRYLNQLHRTLTPR
jgi:hypothetical protein